MTHQPLIGITTYAEPACWGPWNLSAALVPLAYVDCVRAAGARPLMIPPHPNASSETVRVLDGLLLAGGADLDPASYGAAPHPATNGTHPERDAAERELLLAALELDLPILGVCRGMQLLNVALGGALEQHLPDLLGHEGHRERSGRFSDHRVHVDPDSTLAPALPSAAAVKSYHHQGVSAIAAPLGAAAWAEDGTVEALVHLDHTFVVGVLWHPEAGDDPSLFDALAAHARNRQVQSTVGA